MRNLRCSLPDRGERFTSSQRAFRFGGFGRIDQRDDLTPISIDSQWR